ncbi:hypothetical protein [Microbacterium sp. PF5]|uniref:hypothetical protein n=1 Tax=Microbacterium sp. PF5 TaxID=2305435 RepID=UPI001F1043D2|nr:hypothetical protein [Microbacterium sp. PF5]
MAAVTAVTRVRVVTGVGLVTRVRILTAVGLVTRMGLVRVVTRVRILTAVGVVTGIGLVSRVRVVTCVLIVRVVTGVRGGGVVVRGAHGVPSNVDDAVRGRRRAAPHGAAAQAAAMYFAGSASNAGPQPAQQK